MMIYARLFFEFFKTGLFAMGGGMATLPFLYDISDRTGWFTHQNLADMIAVSESTPGPIGVNMATYAGYITAGFPGSLAATLGLITPAAIVSMGIYAFLHAFKDNKYVNAMFYGLRPASAAMITAAGLIVSRVTFFANGIHVKALILAAMLLILTWAIKFTKKLHPVIWIFLSAIIGIVFKF